MCEFIKTRKLFFSPHYKILAVVEDHYCGINFYMFLVQMFEQSEFLNGI